MRISLLKKLVLIALFSLPLYALAQGPSVSGVEADVSSSSIPSSTSSSMPVSSGQVTEPAVYPIHPEHVWNRINLEVAGGYSPILSRGVGYYGPGYTATVGAVDRITPHWNVLFEGQVLGQHGNLKFPSFDLFGGVTGYAVASYIEGFHLDTMYIAAAHRSTSPYVIGGAGYYHLGTHSHCVSNVGTASNCTSTSDDPFVTDDISVNSAGFNFGAGVRHRVSDVRHGELFVDARYHLIASGSSAVGRIGVLPLSAGFRW